MTEKSTASGSGRAAKSDFSQGKVGSIILAQAVPLTVAQMVQLLYNVVDRIYIGHMNGVGSLALTGIGLVFPLTTLVAAFTLLFGNGGAPLFAIARGAKEEDRAEKIMGQVAFMLCITAVVLFFFCYTLRRPILYLFGASDDSYVYADQYLQIYLFGTIFTMFSTGMNGFINAQGFPRIGMGTTLLGAALNMILDPLFIFAFHMGVRGAAAATVISQFASAVWSLLFFLGPKTMYRIRPKYFKPDPKELKEILALGTTGFVMQGTNCAVQIACNKVLNIYGGDLYVGIMTVLNSVREILSLPANGIANGSQPVMSFNFGARKYKRVRQCIRFSTGLVFVYLFLIWGLVMVFPHFIMGLFTNDSQLITAGVGSLRVFVFGFFFMAFQFAGQSAFTALKCPKRAIFFSLFRKIIIVVPLTIILPAVGFGVTGVFMAEPISNAVGGLASFTTMYLTLYRKLPEEDD